jgi:hypothetical protein
VAADPSDMTDSIGGGAGLSDPDVPGFRLRTLGLFAFENGKPLEEIFLHNSYTGGGGEGFPWPRQGPTGAFSAISTTGVIQSGVCPVLVVPD